MQVSLKPSYYLMIWTSLCYGSTVSIWWFMLPIPIWARSIGTILHSLSLYYIMQRYLLLKTSHSIVAIEFTPFAEWKITVKQGTVLAVRPTYPSVCTRHLIILNFKPKDQNTRKLHTMLIASDSTTVVQFRALQRQLRLLN